MQAPSDEPLASPIYNRQDHKVRCLITASKGYEIGRKLRILIIEKYYLCIMKEAYTLQFNNYEILSLHIVWPSILSLIITKSIHKTKAAEQNFYRRNSYNLIYF